MDIFLKALSNRLGKSNKFFIVRESTLPAKFPAYRNFTQSIYAKITDKYEVISEESLNTLVDKIDECKAKVTQKNIENLLERYGI